MTTYLWVCQNLPQGWEVHMLIVCHWNGNKAGSEPVSASLQCQQLPHSIFKAYLSMTAITVEAAEMIVEGGPALKGFVLHKDCNQVKGCGLSWASGEPQCQASTTIWKIWRGQDIEGESISHQLFSDLILLSWTRPGASKSVPFTVLNQLSVFREKTDFALTRKYCF